MTGRTHRAANERIKRDYLIYLKAAKRLSAPSIDKAAAAIDRYLDFGKGRDLKKFHRAHVTAFVEDFVSSTSPVTNKPLSASTINGTLKALRGFAHWLAEQPGYKRAISHTDAEYFGSSEAKAEARGSLREKTPPTVEEIHRVIALMPAETEIEKRDRAVVASTILTGARDAATASFQLKHVDIEQRVLVQDGRESKIKFGKRFRTWFFPVKGEAEAIVGDWVRLLRDGLGFGPDDPLFPRTKIGVGEGGGFEVAGLDRAPWSNAGPIRKIFRTAFERAGLPYANPHLFRDTLALYGLDVCPTLRELQGWSQNLGHESLLTTIQNYAKFSDAEMAKLIQGVGDPAPTPDIVETARALRALLSQLPA